MSTILKTTILDGIASFLIVIKRSVFLALKPYKTMRRISADADMIEVGIIFLFVCAYFFIAHTYRPFYYAPFILFFLVILHVLVTAVFFYSIAFLFGSKQKDIYRHVVAWSYALIPTLIWFTINFSLYLVLPPPRHPSLNGKLFTIVYISFSVSMLLWKIILTYLAIRFSTHMKVSRIVFSFFVYICIVILYAICMYELKFFRIPFL